MFENEINVKWTKVWTSWHWVGKSSAGGCLGCFGYCDDYYLKLSGKVRKKLILIKIVHIIGTFSGYKDIPISCHKISFYYIHDVS